MSTRKIKDAKDLSTNELIYFKGHAKATYMSDGSTVEDAILMSKTRSGNGGNGITIVNSVDELDANAPVGTLACVVKDGGGISVKKFKELTGATIDNIDLNTGIIITNNLPEIQSININPGIPTYDIGNLILSVINGANGSDNYALSEYGLYFCTENCNLMGNNGCLATIGIYYENLSDGVYNIYLDGWFRNCSTGQEQWFSLAWLECVDDSKYIEVDYDALNEFNGYISGMYYMGFFDHLMNGLEQPSDVVYDIYDCMAKASVGSLSKAHIHIKKDTWEELYKEELNKINQKSDVVSNVELEDDGFGGICLQPNTYNRYTFSYDNGEMLGVLLKYPSNPNIYNEYILEVTCTTTPHRVFFYDYLGDEIAIKWANDNDPIFDAGFTYIISIVNGFGVYSSFSN